MQHLYYLSAILLLSTAPPVAALKRSDRQYPQAHSQFSLTPQKGVWAKTKHLIQEDPLNFIISMVVGTLLGGFLVYHQQKNVLNDMVALGAIIGCILLGIVYVIALVDLTPQSEVVILQAETKGIPTGYLATILDLIILLLLLLFGFRGFKNGLVLQFLSTGATLLFLVFAKSIFFSMQHLAKSLWPGLDEAALPFAATALLFLTGIVFFYLAEKFLQFLLQRTFLGYFDSLLGFLLGLIQASFCISTVIWVLESYNIILPEAYVENMRVYQSVAMIIPKCVGILKTYLPQHVTFMIPDAGTSQ